MRPDGRRPAERRQRIRPTAGRPRAPRRRQLNHRRPPIHSSRAPRTTLSYQVSAARAAGGSRFNAVIRRRALRGSLGGWVYAAQTQSWTARVKSLPASGRAGEASAHRRHAALAGHQPRLPRLSRHRRRARASVGTGRGRVAGSPTVLSTLLSCTPAPSTGAQVATFLAAALAAGDRQQARAEVLPRLCPNILRDCPGRCRSGGLSDDHHRRSSTGRRHQRAGAPLGLPSA